MNMSEGKKNCNCCTCNPRTCAPSCCDKVTDTCFKEFQPFPKGIKKEELKLETGKNFYKVCGKCCKTCDSGEKCGMKLEHEREFTKNIHDVQLKEENGHFYVEGKFE